MVLSPMSAILLDEMHITAQQFGYVVSAYAISAGISGLLTAGFADKFDRKKLLLFFYTGFVLGTAFCALAPTYEFLFAARVVTGIFGGVIGSIAFAIITDLFPLEKRGRVMGMVQMAFAASQVLGLPIGLYMANHLGWHSPFWMIVAIAGIIGVFIAIYLKPIDAHLQLQEKGNAMLHLWKAAINTRHLQGFAATVLLATGGYMLMPFGAAFSTSNMGLSLDELPIVYMVTGIFTIFAGPLAGRMSDKFGKFLVYMIGSTIVIALVIVYTNLGITPLWLAILINVVLFIGLTGRMIAASTLMTAVPAPKDRGAFMGINASIQQFSGGISAAIAGMIVVKTPSGMIEHYDTLGFVVTATTIISILLIWNVDRMVRKG